MNRALAIIGVPAVGVVVFYVAVFWGFWPALGTGVALTLGLVAVTITDQRRRRTRAAGNASAGR